MVPHLREKLKDWAFSEETATNISELIGKIPQDIRTDKVALTEFVQSSGLWDKVLAEVKQENIQNKQETNVKGDLQNQVNFQETTLNNPTFNFGVKEESTNSEFISGKKS